jgi:hypothetical protein
MNPFRARREGEEELFGIIRTNNGGEKLVEEKTMEQKMAHSFLNDSGSGMESE